MRFVALVLDHAGHVVDKVLPQPHLILVELVHVRVAEPHSLPSGQWRLPPHKHTAKMPLKSQGLCRVEGGALHVTHQTISP